MHYDRDTDIGELGTDINTSHITQEPEIPTFQSVKLPEPTQKISPCSFQKDEAGNMWPLKVHLVQCSGCGCPVIAVEMANSPFNNEPPTQITLRLDHTTRQLGVAPVCQGAKSQADIQFIDVTRDPIPQQEAGDKA